MLLKKITFPTYLTITRFFLIPVFVYQFWIEQYFTAFIILVIAGITDTLDGVIARRFNLKSRLGSLLDPLADKFLMLCSFLVLAMSGRIPWALSLLVIGRDFLILLISAIMIWGLNIRLLFKPSRFSKAATASQIVVVSAGFLEVYLEQMQLPFHQDALNILRQGQVIFIMAAAILTLVTVGQYGYFAYKFYRYGEQRRPDESWFTTS